MLAILSYEVYVLTYILILLFLKWDSNRNKAFDSTFDFPKIGYKLIISILTFYLIAYAFFRSVWESSFESFIIGLNFFSIIKTWFIFSIGGFYTNFKFGPENFFRTEIIYLFLILVLTLVIVSKFISMENVECKRNRDNYTVLLFVLIVTPNILLSLSKRYQNLVEFENLYLSSINSHIFICVLLSTYFVRLFNSINFRLLATIIIFVLVYLQNLNLQYFAIESFDKNNEIQNEVKNFLSIYPNPLPFDTNYLEKARSSDQKIGFYPYRFFETLR
jgi:hypothetical protein